MKDELNSNWGWEMVELRMSGIRRRPVNTFVQRVVRASKSACNARIYCEYPSNIHVESIGVVGECFFTECTHSLNNLSASLIASAIAYSTHERTPNPHCDRQIVALL